MAASKSRTSLEKRIKRRDHKIRDLQGKIGNLEEKFKILDEQFKNQIAPAPVFQRQSDSGKCSNVPWESDRVIQQIYRMRKEHEDMLGAHYSSRRTQAAVTPKPRGSVTLATPNHGVPLDRVSPGQVRVTMGPPPAVEAPAVQAPTLKAPTVTAPTVTAPTVTAPTVTAPTVTAPTVKKRSSRYTAQDKTTRRHRHSTKTAGTASAPLRSASSTEHGKPSRGQSEVIDLETEYNDLITAFLST